MAFYTIFIPASSTLVIIVGIDIICTIILIDHLRNEVVKLNLYLSKSKLILLFYVFINSLKFLVLRWELISIINDYDNKLLIVLFVIHLLYNIKQEYLFSFFLSYDIYTYIYKNKTKKKIEKGGGEKK